MCCYLASEIRPLVSRDTIELIEFYFFVFICLPDCSPSAILIDTADDIGKVIFFEFSRTMVFAPLQIVRISVPKLLLMASKGIRSRLAGRRIRLKLCIDFEESLINVIWIVKLCRAPGPDVPIGRIASRLAIRVNIPVNPLPLFCLSSHSSPLWEPKVRFL